MSGLIILLVTQALEISWSESYMLYGNQSLLASFSFIACIAWHLFPLNVSSGLHEITPVMRCYQNFCATTQARNSLTKTQPYLSHQPETLVATNHELWFSHAIHTQGTGNKFLVFQYWFIFLWAKYCIRNVHHEMRSAVVLASLNDNIYWFETRHMIRLLKNSVAIENLAVS